MNLFPDVIGQEMAKEIFRKAIAGNRLGHAYLLYGPAGVGKRRFALAVARVLNCSKEEISSGQECPSCRRINTFSHPDVRWLFPLPKDKTDESWEEREERRGKLLSSVRLRPLGSESLEEVKEKSSWDFEFDKIPIISIEDVRGISREINYKPFLGRKRVVIFSEADKMRIEAANAFLKILEEPPLNTIFLLTTTRLNFLLPTILSRCQKVRFHLLKEEEIRKALTSSFALKKEEAEVIACLSEGSLGQAILLLESTDLRKKGFEIFQMISSASTTLEIIEMIESLAKTENRQSVLHLINYLLLFYSDLLLLKEEKDSLIRNKDKLDGLKEINQKFSKQKIQEAIDFLEKMREAIIANANLLLTLLVMFLRLREMKQ
ncbi:MAG: DNA polymerase III subunit delta' [Candidatus Edwardsbacteria bacterium]